LFCNEQVQAGKIFIVKIQQRLLKFVKRTNWILFFAGSILGWIAAPPDFATGLVLGGLIALANFHLLSRTLKNTLTPSHLSSHNVAIAKYYVRFLASAFVIFLLISGDHVNPLGLLSGLSVVVVSIMLATVCEFRKLFLKEAI
jgi:hypothetical protein